MVEVVLPTVEEVGHMEAVAVDQVVIVKENIFLK
jgi:hypothetical protein